MDFSLFKPNLINMNVHSATCSCSDELYKQWYTLADFLPNWDISRGFLDVSITSEHSGKIHTNTLIFCVVFSLYSIICRKDLRSCDEQDGGRGTHYDKYDNKRAVLYAFADFFQNWNFSRGFLYIIFIHSRNLFTTKLIR